MKCQFIFLQKIWYLHDNVHVTTVTLTNKMSGKVVHVNKKHVVQCINIGWISHTIIVYEYDTCGIIIITASVVRYTMGARKKLLRTWIWTCLLVYESPGPYQWASVWESVNIGVQLAQPVRNPKCTCTHWHVQCVTSLWLPVVHVHWWFLLESMTAMWGSRDTSCMLHYYMYIKATNTLVTWYFRILNPGNLQIYNKFSFSCFKRIP